MKTGRLIKFQRPEGDIQAYLFQEDGRFHGVVYRLSDPAAAPIHREHGTSEQTVEQSVRAWVEQHYPRSA
jgi:hypothetical protein